MLELLTEIGYHGFTKKSGKLDLDAKHNWYDLSGGEKKKVNIVSVILKNPNILILDEVFNGLSIEAIYQAQNMLKKYLPDRMILIVDHHAENDNYDGFYDGGELHFSDKRIIQRDIQ